MLTSRKHPKTPRLLSTASSSREMPSDARADAPTFLPHHSRSLMMKPCWTEISPLGQETDEQKPQSPIEHATDFVIALVFKVVLFLRETNTNN